MLQPKDTDWLNGYKHKTHIYSIYKKATSDLKTHIYWKWEDRKIYYIQMESKKKKAGVTILLSDNVDFKIKKITRDKEGHYTIIKGSIPEEDIIIVTIYAPNIGAPQYLRQTLTDIKGETDRHIIIVEDFNTWLTPMDKSSKQKINKETQVLNDTLDEMDLIGIFRTFHSNAEEYIFLWNAHGRLSGIDHILGHKSSYSKFKKIEIV